MPSASASPPNIADDGTEFTRAFIRRGRGEDATHRRPSITERAKRLRTAPLERLLTPAELLDPELVDFWTDDVAQSVSLPGTQSVGTGGQSISMGWDDSDASSQSLKPTPNRGGMIKVDCTSKRLLPACKASRAAAGIARRALHEAASASNSRSRAACVQATDRTYGSGSPADSQQVMHASSVTVAQSLWKYDAKAQRWTWAARPQHDQHNDSGEQWWAGVEALIQRDDLLAAGSCEHHRLDGAAEFFDLDDGSAWWHEVEAAMALDQDASETPALSVTLEHSDCSAAAAAWWQEVEAAMSLDPIGLVELPADVKPRGAKRQPPGSPLGGRPRKSKRPG